MYYKSTLDPTVRWPQLTSIAALSTWASDPAQACDPARSPPAGFLPFVLPVGCNESIPLSSAAARLILLKCPFERKDITDQE